MNSYERLYTKVFEGLGRTFYINAMWRERKVGFYVENSYPFRVVSIGLLLFELNFYKWRDE